jgi:uncharacterized protein (UPF0335 family)
MTSPSESNTVAKDRLRSFVERVERLAEEKQAIADDIKEVFSEAKSSGFDTKILRDVLRRRKLTPQERKEQDDMIDMYEQALGMFE